MRRFLLLSLAFHFGLSALLLIRARGVRPYEEPAAVMVDLTEAPAPRLGGGGRITGGPAKGPQPVPASPSLPLSALAPNPGLAMQPLHPGEQPSPSAAADSFSPYAASENVLESAPKEASGAIAWVYRKAQLTIGYPAPFIRHDITGSAQARLVFDSHGKLLRDLLRVRADSPYLRIYVYRVLESTFTRENVPANLVRWPDTFEVFCTVRFQFAESETAVTVEAPAPILGNKIFFARRSVKSAAEKLKWEIGPLRGMFPVPMVGMDMTWFYRKLEEKKHPLRAQIEADDLAPFRNDPLFPEQS